MAAPDAPGPAHRAPVIGPQDGSQYLFLTNKAFECLYHGTRGPVKTTALILDFLKEVGKGHGPACLANEGRFGIAIGEDGDRVDAHVVGGAQDAPRDLAPVGDEQPADSSLLCVIGRHRTPPQ